MKFDILNRFTGAIQFTAKIDCAEDAPRSVKIGLAVRWAIRTRANLSGADLTRANLSGADLRWADLTRANLSGADLSRANLSGADLSGADLRWADLSRANLSGATLSGADLSRANLSGADLSGADLRWADLSGANLSGADLSRADLRWAKDADLAVSRTRILPDGDLIGWKKCSGGILVKLRIPADARRSHAFGRKCRAEFADVLEVIGADEGVSSVPAATAEPITYRAGARVFPLNGWDEDWTRECSGGIHFFITRIEAENYEI